MGAGNNPAGDGGQLAAQPRPGERLERTAHARLGATAGLVDVFETIVTSSDVVNAKPAPDIYLRACQDLGVDPSEALALEDSASGVAAAKSAGLTCIAVPQFAETDVSAADRIVDSLEELLRP